MIAFLTSLLEKILVGLLQHLKRYDETLAALENLLGLDWGYTSNGCKSKINSALLCHPSSTFVQRSVDDMVRSEQFRGEMGRFTYYMF